MTMEMLILSKSRLCLRQSDLERCASDFNPTYWISATVTEAAFAAVLGLGGSSTGHSIVSLKHAA
jgi:hypothetical protein